MSFRWSGIPNFFELAVRADEKRAADDTEKGFAEEFLHAARAVGFDGFEFRIAEQIEIQLLLGFERGLGFDRVAACAEDDDAKLVEVMLCVTKLGRFGRSTGCICFGIEKEDDTPAEKIGKRNIGTCVVLEGERGGFTAYFEHGNLRRIQCSRERVYAFKRRRRTMSLTD